MANKIGTINLFQNNSNRATLRVAKSFGAAPSGQSADAAKISFTGRQSEGHPVQSGLLTHISEAREHQAALRAERMELARQAQSAREAAEAQAEYMRLLQLAMQIAGRIMRGDNVPQSDKDFLLERSPGMYMLAMSARNHHNEDPKDYQALARGEGTTSTAAGDFGQGQANIPDISAVAAVIAK
jgi:hypothetical protein